MAKNTVIRTAAFVFALALALGLGLGLGLGLKKDGNSSTAEVVPTYKLASSTALTGLTVADFSDQPRLAFRTGMAKTLDVAVSQVNITNVSASAKRRRNLLQSSSKINVEFDVEISASAVATSTGGSANSVTAESLLQIVAVITQKITETPPSTILANLNEAFDDVAPNAGIQITTVTAPAAPIVVEVVTSSTGVVTAKTVCGANQRVSSKTCVACATGSTNKAGDDPAGADTQCDIGVSPPPPPSPPPSPPPPGIYCAANQRVVSNACVACPAGTRNSAGDAQSGADTSCTKIKCTVNQHVVSNLCVACSAWTTNVAGDDASGANTSCDAGDSSDGDSTDRDVTFG